MRLLKLEMQHLDRAQVGLPGLSEVLQDTKPNMRL